MFQLVVSFSRGVITKKQSMSYHRDFLLNVCVLGLIATTQLVWNTGPICEKPCINTTTHCNALGWDITKIHRICHIIVSSRSILTFLCLYEPSSYWEMWAPFLWDIDIYARCKLFRGHHQKKHRACYIIISSCLFLCSVAHRNYLFYGKHEHYFWEATHLCLSLSHCFWWSLVKKHCMSYL